MKRENRALIRGLECRSSRKKRKAIGGLVYKGLFFFGVGFVYIVKRFFSLLDGSKEPRVFEKVDRKGNAYFRVYDPVSGVHHTFHSTSDVYIWLEERHHNSRNTNPKWG